MLLTSIWSAPHWVDAGQAARLTIRRACSCSNLAGLRYLSAECYDELMGQPIEEGQLMTQITEICAEFPRYGYRRITAQQLSGPGFRGESPMVKQHDSHWRHTERDPSRAANPHTTKSAAASAT